MMPSLLRWQWRTKPTASEPDGVMAWADAAMRLHARLTTMDEAQQARLSATAHRDALILTGAANDLPWVEGVGYFSRCPEAAELYLPTLLEVDVPADLLSQALSKRHARKPLLLWPDPAAVLPLDRLLPLSPSLLNRIASNWQASHPKR